MIRWAAIVIASLSWVFAFHHMVTEEPVRQWSCILAGLLLLTWGLRKYDGQIRPGLGYLLLLIPLAVALVLADPAYRPPLIVLAVGCVVLTVAGASRSLAFLAPTGLSASMLGAILVLQSPLYWLSTSWTARNPEVPYIGRIFYILLNWIGADVGYSNHTLFVRLMRHTHSFPLTWEHLAIYPLMLIGVAGAAVVWWNRDRRSPGRSLSILSATLIFYAVLRLMVMLTVYVGAMVFVKYQTDVVHVEVFWLPWITALSFLPIIPFLSRWAHWPAEEPIFSQARAAPKQTALRTAAIVGACLACLALVAHVHYWDPGEQKQGRILLDEAHSLWERTDKPYDTDWYGHESGYNYYCMAQYLRHYYDLDFNMDGLLTADRLANYDVLILKTPTDAYSAEEVDAIDAFVQKGGGLFILGEHTNVFGSSVCLNPVARRFGFAFRYDSVFDIERKWEQVYTPSKLGRHPTMLDVPFFRFAVSCSIASNSWKSRPIIRSTGLWDLPIEWAAGNFYPSVQDRSDAVFGAFNQIMSTTAGAGRVVAFGDSTVYSNFLAFYPGKPEFLLGTIDWLNRTNRWDWLNGVALAAFAICLVVSILLAWRLTPNLGGSLTVAAVGAGLVWASIWGFSAQTKAAFGTPAVKTPVHHVVFDMSHGDLELPIFSFTQNYAKSYEIFYQFVLRLGYYTTLTFNLDRALQSADDPIVIVKPKESFSPETISYLRGFLERGGSLLVLDSYGNLDSTANELIAGFGLKFRSGPCRGTNVVEPTTGTRICGLMSGRAIEGGTPVLQTNAGDPIVAFVRVGKGQLIAAGAAERFTDVQMGGSTRTVPNPQLRAAFELEYELIRGLVEGDLQGTMKRLGQTFYVPPTTTQPSSQPSV